ncbi:hypothetical protein ACIRVF_08430 [Kitasatospora sp. NPDC101157]|uniref:hypothetical protein n=1 Tax=Kitasatospora sp. NPDC101157 TaxID=3364098 RepID=UPI00380F4100
MPNPLPLPDDLLSLHAAAVEADRAMTATREAGGDVDAARDAYVTAALSLRAHRHGRREGPPRRRASGGLTSGIMASWRTGRQ